MITYTIAFQAVKPSAYCTQTVTDNIDYMRTSQVTKGLFIPLESQQQLLIIFLAKGDYWYHAPKQGNEVRAITHYIPSGDYQYAEIIMPASGTAT